MKKVICCAFLFIFGIFLISSIYGQEKKENFVKAYRIGPMDLLEIKVFELPELNQTVRVSEDGSITMALLGKVTVGGLTKDEIEQELAGLLEKKYIKHAKVMVFIKEYQSKRVALIGAVKNPGMYELVGRRTLLQMISQAGGFAENAGNELFVLREGENGNSATLSIDLEDLLKNGNQKLNIPLMPNDIINVPADKTVHIYVFGSVKSPGAIRIKASDMITLLQAIAQAGGLAEGASKKGILIKRTDKDGREKKIKVNLKDIIKGKKPDISLQEGDVVYVPESVW